MRSSSVSFHRVKIKDPIFHEDFCSRHTDKLEDTSLYAQTDCRENVSRKLNHPSYESEFCQSKVTMN